MSMVPYGAQPQDAHQLLGTVGDISFSANSVNVPGRSFPMAGTIWNVRDMSVTTTRIPGWAIVCAILFALFCLLGLFFLLVKETTTTGYVEVEVRHGADYHVSQIPVQGTHTIMQVRQIVDYARSLATWAYGQQPGPA
jgi:hypothetical protein